MLNFDTNGYLIPDKLFAVDYETLIATFVTNEHRLNLFKVYLEFLNTLKELASGDFYQWLNGSFISLNPRPADIDVVTFLDYQKYESLESTLRELKRNFKFVDSYFVRVFPEEHPDHFITKFDQVEWANLFSTDRKKHKKGFIQLNFNGYGNN